MQLDAINLHGANLIAVIQEQSPDSDDIFDNIALAFEPVHAFSILFPFLASINVALATDILVVAASTEWLTMIFKWLLREDRPFWWVRETALAEPALIQTTSTCATSFGSPSEHVAVAAAVGYALAASASRGRGPGRSALVWTALALATMLATLSRLLPAASFPHQCLLGAALGLAVSHIALSSRLRLRWQSAGRCSLLALAIASVLVALAAYWIQRAAGMDPQASVKLAFKWCESPEVIHVSTTPLFSLVRATGSALGLALSAPLGTSRCRLPIVPALLSCAFLSWALNLAAENVPTHSATMFFFAHFLLATFRVPIFLRLLPLLGRNKAVKVD